jgi:hypothetical protein
MHMPFKLWQIMTLILCAFFFLHVLFHLNPIRVAIANQLTIVQDDDLFFG